MAPKRLNLRPFKLLLALAAITLCFNAGKISSVYGAVEEDEIASVDAEPELLHTHEDDSHMGSSAPATANKKPVLKIQDEKPYSPPELKENEPFYLYEPFRTSDLLDKSWLMSTAKKDDVEESLAKYDGQWKIEEAKQAHLKNDLGLVVKSKAKHHAIATRLAKPFSFDNGESLVLQFDLKFQEGQDCGGGYVKLLSSGQEQNLNLFMDKTPFTIMFGPDKCGLESKLHFIVKLRNPITGELEEKKASQPKEKIEKFITDKLTHLYTLVFQPDNKFSIYIDQKLVHSGSLLKDFEPPINPPKEIKDPNAVKPADWDDREQITDETDVKPESWIEERLVPDPKAEKPEDWDDEMDGVWEAPKIDNPNFKGEWRAKQIKNPKYSGVWKHPMIPNPAYFDNSKPFQSLAPISAVGIELWTMSADIMFDNFIITSDKKQADRIAKETWSLKAERERAAEGITTTSSTISGWFDYAKAHPWVWGLFLVGLGLPIAFIIMSYAKRSQQSSGVGQKSAGRQSQQQQRKPTGSEDEESDDDADADQQRKEEQDDDDELIDSNRSATTTQKSQDLLRSSPSTTATGSSSARRQADTQRTDVTNTTQKTDNDSPPPELESAESAEEEEEDDDNDVPPAEAGDKVNAANNKVAFEQVTTTTKTTTVEHVPVEMNDAEDAGGATSNLRSRARRPRREE